MSVVITGLPVGHAEPGMPFSALPVLLPIARLALLGPGSHCNHTFSPISISHLLFSEIQNSKHNTGEPLIQHLESKLLLSCAYLLPMPNASPFVPCGSATHFLTGS